MQLKTIFLSLFIGVIFLFITKNTFAQPPGAMAQVRAMENQQFMHMQMNMQMNMIMNMPMRKRVGNSSYIPGGSNEYIYNVVMKDGSKKIVRSYIYIDTVKNENYLILVDKHFSKSDSAHRFTKIYNNETVSISRDITPWNSPRNAAPVYYIGMATDSCWLFHAVKGKIGLYSFFSEDSEISLF